MSTVIDVQDYNKVGVDLFVQIGLAVCTCQPVEKTLRALVGLVYPKDPAANLVSLFSEYNPETKSTAGQLILALSKRASLSDDLSADLSRFLEMRNTVIHDLNRIDGFKLQTKAGRAAGIKYSKELSVLASKLFVTLYSIQMKWFLDIGIPSEEVDNAFLYNPPIEKDD